MTKQIETITAHIILEIDVDSANDDNARVTIIEPLISRGSSEGRWGSTRSFRIEKFSSREDSIKCLRSIVERAILKVRDLEREKSLKDHGLKPETEEQKRKNILHSGIIKGEFFPHEEYENVTD